MAVVGEDERSGEGADLLRGLPFGVVRCGLARWRRWEAAFGSVCSGNAQGGCETCWDGGCGLAGVGRGDFDEDFVVAGLEERGDLFPVEGAEVGVLAGGGAVDGGGEVADGEDVEAGSGGCGVEVKGVAEFGFGAGWDGFGVGVGEPEPADGG